MVARERENKVKLEKGKIKASGEKATVTNIGLPEKELEKD